VTVTGRREEWKKANKLTRRYTELYFVTLATSLSLTMINLGNPVSSRKWSIPSLRLVAELTGPVAVAAIYDNLFFIRRFVSQQK